MKPSTLIPLPRNTPAFRVAVFEAATKTYLKESPCGRWLDIIALRGEDRVYISTLPKAA